MKLLDRLLYVVYLIFKEFDFIIFVNGVLMDEVDRGGLFIGICIYILGFMMVNSLFLIFWMLDFDNDFVCSFIWKG